ncbi:MAG: HRDC domain-containing protein [Anaerolineales bacterium]|nr:HRDC domain-containing protein [Anaerolineales bacterium]
MDELKLPPPVLVQDFNSLERLIPQLQKEERIGIDTESNSLYAYKEQVCLIQISTSRTDYLVDPLQINDISPMGSVLADSSIEKILHGAEYDVICLHRDFNFQINNLFDSRVACRTLGWKKTGLGDILEMEFHVRVNKRFQRANWGKRPLPGDQLHYARMDTHFLIPLREKLVQSLRNSGRWEEAYEENQRLTHIPLPENGFDPEGFWNITHATKLSAHSQAILRELYLLRDKYARSQNRPPFKVMGNKTLLEIAEHAPHSMGELETLHGMTSGQMHRYGDEILRAVRIGSTAPRPVRPRSPKANESVVFRYKCLLDWRREAALQRQVESDVILSKDVVWEIASENPTGMEALRELMRDLPRRLELYGDQILAELRNCPTRRRKGKR